MDGILPRFPVPANPGAVQNLDVFIRLLLLVSGLRESCELHAVRVSKRPSPKGARKTTPIDIYTHPTSSGLAD